MTNTPGFNPFHWRGTSYLLQLLAVIAVLAALWFIDPLGWHKTQAVPVPVADTLPPPPSTMDDITKAQTALGADPENPTLRVNLATLYLQYVRESGDPSYYNKADEILKRELADNPQDFFALLDMGNLALARHDFTGALDWGNKAAALNGMNWLVFGVIGDANVELGKYPDAEKAFDKMISLRPDVASYSRISYMRELLGNTDGAIEAMSRATRMGMANTEPSNWARVQLGTLYFNMGKLDQAEELFQTSLQLYPDYIHALAGMGMVRAARGDYAGSIQYYQKALRQIPIPQYVIALGDVYGASGDTKNAQKQYALISVIQQLYTANGVDMDLEIAMFNADHQIDLQKTLASARVAYLRRPSIYGADVMAWVLYQTGNYQEAQKYSQESLRLGTVDALKEYHAGMIALKLGDKDGARTHLARALQINPYFSLLYAAPAKQTLQSLQ